MYKILIIAIVSRDLPVEQQSISISIAEYESLEKADRAFMRVHEYSNTRSRIDIDAVKLY